MTSSFDDITLKPSGKIKLKLPKKFGASDAKGTVVELQTNVSAGDNVFYLELFNKKGTAERVTKATAKNFLKFVNKKLYDGMIFHRSVPGFVLQGGGFSAPLVSSSEGGMPSEIKDFGMVDNQPGNSNVKGTVAMAKIGGLPDSATNQWFINLNDNFSLNTQNQGFTVFGNVLGSGMNIVESLSNADIFNFGGAFSQFPLWKSPEADVGIQPADYLTVDKARKLSAKKQPFALEVQSSDENVLAVSVNKKQHIKLKAMPGVSGTAEVSVRSTSLVDGSVNEESFDVLIGKAPSMRQQSGKPRRKIIDILVDGGSFDDPFYRFYDLNGDELEKFKINVKKVYRFKRLDDAESHPFYIGDSGFNQPSSKYIKIKGDGTFDSGIVGSESFAFRFKKKHRAKFKQIGRLDYFCTSHSSMLGSFEIKGSNLYGSMDTQPQDAIVSMV